MEIIRIPTSYALQIKHLSEKDIAYVMKSIFLLSTWEQIEIEDNMRWWLVQSIWREIIQLENKARAKKWEEWLSYQLATQGATWSIKTCDQAKPNQIKSNQAKSNQNSSKEEWEQALALKKEEFWDCWINELLEIIKWQVEFLWLIYKKGTQERQRAQNILTGKDFWEVCEKANMSRVEFCKSIIYTSSLLTFWNGKINNAETLYKHYAQVYNDAVNKKTEMENRPRRWIEV